MAMLERSLLLLSLAVLSSEAFVAPPSKVSSGQSFIIASTKHHAVKDEEVADVVVIGAGKHSFVYLRHLYYRAPSSHSGS